MPDADQWWRCDRGTAAVGWRSPGSSGREWSSPSALGVSTWAGLLDELAAMLRGAVGGGVRLRPDREPRLPGLRGGSSGPCVRAAVMDRGSSSASRRSGPCWPRTPAAAFEGDPAMGHLDEAILCCPGARRPGGAPVRPRASTSRACRWCPENDERERSHARHRASTCTPGRWSGDGCSSITGPAWWWGRPRESATAAGCIRG